MACDYGRTDVDLEELQRAHQELTEKHQTLAEKYRNLAAVVERMVEAQHDAAVREGDLGHDASGYRCSHNDCATLREAL